jgi:hypothetical protein
LSASGDEVDRAVLHNTNKYCCDNKILDTGGDFAIFTMKAGSYGPTWCSGRGKVLAAITMNDTRKYPRLTFPAADGIPVTVIQFGKLERVDLTVKGVDISDGGLGIQSDIPLSPGFVWFWSAVGPHKGGMIVWSRKEDRGYRAGIQFLPIPLSPRDYLQVADD